MKTTNIPQPPVLSVGDRVYKLGPLGARTAGIIFGAIADIDGPQYIMITDTTGTWLSRNAFEFVAGATEQSLDELFAHVAANCSAGNVTALAPDWRADLPQPTLTDVQVPEVGTVWEHYNKLTSYEILAITNESSTDQTRYPTTVVYRGLDNAKLWSRPLWDWHRSMTRLS